MDARLQRTGSYRGSIQRIVRGECTGVDGEWVSRAISDDSAPTPSTYDGIQPPGSIRQHGSAAAHRQVVDVVAGYNVPRVKIRTCPAGAQIGEVAYQTSSSTGVSHVVVCDGRNVVDGMRERVIKLELQTLRETLTHV